MERKIDNPAKYRYEGRMLMMLPFLALIACFCIWAKNHIHVTGIYAYLLAALFSLIPIAPIVLSGLYLAEEKDEFERTVLVQSILWAAGGTMVLGTFWGCLELFAQVSNVNPIWIFVVFGFLMGIAQRLVKLRYR